MGGLRNLGIGTTAVAVTLLGQAALPDVGAAAGVAAAVPVTVVASVPAFAPDSQAFGDLDVRNDSVYAVHGLDRVERYPADGSTPDSPDQSVMIPEAWRSDGWWQSDVTGMVAAADGSLYLRAPNANHNGGGGVPNASGWGVGHLATDGVISPVAVPPGGSLGGMSESLAWDPSGSGLFLGGLRGRADGQLYGVVARVPLPAPADQQTAQIVASADGYDPNDSSTYHAAPFLPSQHLDARTEPFLARSIGDVDAKGDYVYLADGANSIERVDRTTHEIVTVAGGPYLGWNTPPPAEGDLATDAFLTVGAGPVADRAGNLFFEQGGTDRFNGDPGTIFEIRASDGRLHRIAGGGSSGDTHYDAGDDPLSLTLHVADLALDSGGNLYAVNNGGYYSGNQILRFDGVAAADTAPTAPRNLAVSTDDGSLRLAFDAPVDDGGTAVTGYTATAHPHGVSGSAQDVVAHATTSPITLNDLANGTTYDVSLVATNAVGDGPAATVSGSPAEANARMVVTQSTGDPRTYTLDASGSRAPAGTTYRFWCGDSNEWAGPAGGATSATCTYARASDTTGWQATVRLTNPATGHSFEASRRVVVAELPGRVEGSAAFDTSNVLARATAAADGSLTSASCGSGTVGATCVTRDGARFVFTAAPGTFPAGTTVDVYLGDTSALQNEISSSLTATDGFAITWTTPAGTHPTLSKPLSVHISPTGGAVRSMVTHTGRADLGLDLGGWIGGLATSIGSGTVKALETIGTGLSSAANAVKGAAVSVWEGFTSALRRPNGSATNDVVSCVGGQMESTGLLGLTRRCTGFLSIARDVPTDTIAALNAGAGVVAAGGANVVAAGGGNVVAAGGANIVSTLGMNQLVTLNSNAVVAAGGANVVAAGGANVVAAGGGNVIAPGGANVVAAGGGNVFIGATSDPGFGFVQPADATPPTETATLSPAPPSSGVYPYGTVVHVHLAASAAGAKTIKNVGYDVTGAQHTAYTQVAGHQADLTVEGSGTSTLSYTALDDQFNDAGLQTLDVTIDGAPQTITFAQPAGLTYGAPDSSLVASASSDLPVTLTSLTPGVCTVTTTTLHVVSAGTCTVEATQEGTDTVAAAPAVQRTLTVAKALLTVRADNATMLRGGTLPDVAPTYTGFVGGDNVRDLIAPAHCVANKRKRTTGCSGVQATSYRAVYRKGRLSYSRTGFAIVSAATVYWRAARKSSFVVAVAGTPAPVLKLTGRLPSGVRAVYNRSHTSLKLVGKPTTGTYPVTVIAVRKRHRVATQTLTLHADGA